MRFLLLRVLDTADLAQQRHLYLTGIGHFSFDLVSDVTGDFHCCIIVYFFVIYDDAYFTACLDCVGIFDAFEVCRDFFKLFQAFYISFECFSPCARPRCANGISGGDQWGIWIIRWDIAVMSGDSI